MADEIGHDALMVITLTGRLICADEEQADLVRRHLPRHIELTRAEAGCLAFEVEQTHDPLIWAVSERFVDQTAFDAHARRVEQSEWGRATAGIRRDYRVERS